MIHRIWETVYCFIKFRASQQKFLKTEIALIIIKSIFSNSIYLFLFRILKIESEFFKHVDLSQASLKLGLEMDVVDLLFRFWILKRRSQANRPLFIPRMTDDTEAGLTVSLSLFFNSRFLRKRGMASTPKVEYQVFLCIFQKNSAMAGYLKFEGNRNIPSNLR